MGPHTFPDLPMNIYYSLIYSNIGYNTLIHTLIKYLDIITARSSHVCSTDIEKDTQQAAEEARWGLQGIHIDNFPLSDIFILP